MPKTKGNADVAVGFCLDETGSMGPTASATISGFNEYVDGLRSQKSGSTTMTITRFSDVSAMEPTFRPLCASADISKVPKLSTQNYQPRGGTPLFDAIGSTITEMDAYLKGVEKALRPSSVIIVIQTDGEENASREYTREKIVDLIRAREKKGWNFVYLGADQDDYTAERASQMMGMSVGSSFSYATADSVPVMRTASVGTGAVRAARASGMHVNSAQLSTAMRTGEDPFEADLTEAMAKPITAPPRGKKKT